MTRKTGSFRRLRELPAVHEAEERARIEAEVSSRRSEIEAPWRVSVGVDDV
jgi:hypothetical protein